MPATSLTLRLQKGSPLTYTELDNNFLFITSSISSSISTAISGSVNRVAVFSSANKITGSNIEVNLTSGNTVITADSTIDPILSITSTSGYPGIYSETDSSTGIQGYSTGTGTGVLATTNTGIALKAQGPVQITGSIVASGSTYTFIGNTAVSGSLIASGSSHTIAATTINNLTAPTTIITSNAYTRIGGTNAATFDITRLFVHSTNRKVYTYYNGDLGLNVDFSNNLYQLGDFGKINNSNYISIDDNVASSVVSIPSSSLQVGLGATITGSLIASGSTHTLTSTTTNINSTTTTLNSTALYLYSNHITASGQTPGDIDFTIATTFAGSAIINLKANTGGTSILNATGNNNTLSIKTNSIERINIDGNGTTAITGSLSVTGSNTLIGTKIITGSVFISGSKTVIGTNTITGSLNVSGSVNIKGGVSASSFTGSLFGTASYALTASYVAGGSTFDYEYLSLTGTNSSTANVLTKSYTDVDSAGGNYCKLPLSPTIGTTIYVSNIDSTMNLFVVGNTSQFISISGTSNLVTSFNAGVSSNQIYVFKAISSTVWKLYITPSYISQEKTYKVYSALLTQSSTSAPTAIVLQNDFAGVTFTWNYDNVGDYYIQASANAFTNNKTMCFITADYAHPKNFSFSRLNNTVCQILSLNSSGVTPENTFLNVSVEIRVYN